MVINNNYDMNSHVKFVSYTGKYPNLCSGILTLEIDGVNYTFGSSWNNPKPDFYSFWCSGGGITRDWDTYDGEWRINVDDLPEQFREYAAEIDEIFNSNVRWGCCGGCI
jgi:hypothetical protein